MKKEEHFKIFFYRQVYLLIVAGWLFTISLFFNNYWSGTSTLKNAHRLLETDIQKKEKEINALLRDSVLIHSLIAAQYNVSVSDAMIAKPYYVFIYSGADTLGFKMLYWNTSLIQPTEEQLNRDGVFYERMSNGDYVAVSRNLVNNDKAYKFIALIPVRWNYFINTDYLQNNFIINPALEKKFEITSTGGGLSVTSITGTPLFNLKSKTYTPIPHLSWWTIAFKLAGAMFVLYFIQLVAVWLVINRARSTGVIFLFSIIILLRVVSYYLPLPLNFRQFEMFDPAIYSSTYVFRSLGDLVINTLLFLWLILFAYNNLQFTRLPKFVKTEKGKWIMAALLGFAIVIITSFAGNIMRSLITDSEISFNVTNFFSLTVYSYVGILMLCGIAMSYFICTQILFGYFKLLFPDALLKILLSVVSCGFFYLTIKAESNGFFEIYLFTWLLLFLVVLNFPVFSLNFKALQSSILLIWYFFFSASMSLLLIAANDKKEINERKRMAEKLSLQADPSSESLMSIGLANFNNIFLYDNFYRFSGAATAKKFKDSLLNENFSGYLNKYDTRFYTFDKQEKPLFNDDSVSFNSLSTILTVQGKPTSVSGLYYFETSFDKYSYICRRDIIDPLSSDLAGYAFIVSKPRKYKSDALQPELFARNSSFAFIEKSPLYAYGIYSGLQLVNNFNDYPFPINLTRSEVPHDEFEIRRRGSNEELWYKASPNRLVVVVRKGNFLLEAITLFAYLFCAFLVAVALIQLVNLLIQSQFRIERLKQYKQFTIRNQVHSTIIFISLLSFIVIGFSTIQFFITRYNRNNKEKLARTIQIVASEVKSELDKHSTFDDVLKVYDDITNIGLDQVFAKISEIHNVDVSLYDLDGNLKLASNKIVYSKGLLSEKINPNAFFRLTKMRQIQHVQNEKIGKRNFLSIYVPVRDNNGSVYAYLNIPSFYSSDELNQEISNFLVTIINLNAFIFLIAGLIALLITNRITQSFSIIGEKMKVLRLGRNEEIVWTRNDEIGDLVKEYNKMVRQLDESARLLAKSEREGAWREMARQVAHEIKNPLTPMKLSIQYLQKAVDNNTPNVKEMTAKVATTLVEQIDHLSKIAGEFSQFANIGNVNNEEFDLFELLYSVVSLYRTQDNLMINWEKPTVSQIIYADKTQVNRLFTNLLQNAVQSVPETKKPQININQQISDHLLTISITDNGLGIPKEVQSKIFTPNFTTKTSGTGLGLAMCKGIVENIKGKIWFETREGVGSTFYIQVPVRS
ncbi:MAG TPA: HAMP domain-containing sensor histidine kinase [Chitinophagaceae bacterium]|nr:HAMP domain-containing sensor histidine kinase [Chitinophagaceae bacterium]